MNDQDITAAEGFGKDAVRLDEGHVVGQGGIPDRFENPGLPPHVPRGADLSEAAAKRAEKQVAGLFTLSILGTVLFVLAYFLVDIRTMAYLPGIGDMSLQHVLLGVGMGLAWAMCRPPTCCSASASVWGCSASASVPSTGPRPSCPTRKSSRCATPCAARTPTGTRSCAS